MSGVKRVAIIGGGIAGLATAYYLDRRIRERGLPLVCRLFEAAPALGGVIRSERIDGFLLDTGPDSLFRGKPAAAHLAREIGLGDELLDASPQKLPTLIWSRGKLRPLPAGLELIAPTRVIPFLMSGLISMPGKIRMAMEPFIPAKRDGEDESVSQFARRRLGDEAARKIAGPLLAGIHAGDPERLSIWSTFSRLPELERRHGSLLAGIRAMRAKAAASGSTHGRPARSGPPFTSFRSGIRTIVDGMVGAIKDVVLETGCEVRSIERAGGRYRIDRGGGDPWEADACLVAVSAPRASSLLKSLAPEIASILETIRYASSATVFLGYRAGSTGPLPGATGFLIPFSEKRRIFGCTFVSNKFEGRAPEGHILIRAFVGGATDEGLAELPDGAMLEMVRQELRDLIGLQAEPVMTHIARWPKGNPQYEIGHGKRVEAIDRALAAHPGLFVTGSAFRGVGIPDGVTLGKAAAAEILSFLGWSVAADAVPAGAGTNGPAGSLPGAP